MRLLDLVAPTLRPILQRGYRDALGAARPAVDFANPPGEPALAPEDGVAWRVFANPVTLFIGGVSAVILELAEPRVRAGVWTHSRFVDDPVGRMRRTGANALSTVYAARSVAEARIAGVNRMHARVHGLSEDGEPYNALDPELLVWVQATAAFGFWSAFDAYAAPLTPAEIDAFLHELAPAAHLYGAANAPRRLGDWDALTERMRPRLAPHPVLNEFLSIVAGAPAAPALARPLQGALVRAAVALIPPALRARLELEPRWRLRPGERWLVRTAARVAGAIDVDENPAVIARLRLAAPEREGSR